MKKEILLFLILLSSIIYAAKVDDSIYSALNNEDKIKVIIHLNEKENKSPFTVAQETASELNINKKRSFSVIPGFTAEITQEEFESLKNNKNVKAIYLDKKYKLTLQDSVPLINATEVTKRLINNLNITGKSKTVCILDTGINYTHESFGSCSTTDFVNGNCPKVLTGYDYINSDNDPYDLHGHGTHVAGIIGANGVVRGVAPEVNLISIKVCNDAGDCDGSAISSGLDFCIQNATAYNISAISISIGSTTLYSSYCDSSSSFTSFINDAVGKNITVVVATGNDGSTTGIADPSCVKNSTAVSSTTKTDSISSFSNRNSLVDFFAPGSSIYSTYYNGKYATFSGTSMATPHVSGVVALLQSYKQLESNKTLTQPEVESALANSWKTITVNSLNIPRVDALYSLFYIDNKKPIINLDIVNASLFNSTNVILNYSVSDTNLDSCFYNLNGENNISLSSCQNTTITLSNLSNTLTLYANDSKGNLNFSQINIFLSTTTSELLSPLNNINSSSNDIQFSCRGTTNQPYSLNNITLFHNISQEFSANETDTSINGAFLATPSFNLYDIPDGTYIWNCLVRSNSTINNETFAPTNLTITIDTKKPIINSISSSPSTSEATITFTTSESANSTLHYGTTTDTSSNSVSLNKVTSHSFTLSSLSSSTTYYYNITSCDYAGNCNTSSQSTFNTTTSQTTTSSTSTSTSTTTTSSSTSTTSSTSTSTTTTSSSTSTTTTSSSTSTTSSTSTSTTTTSSSSSTTTSSSTSSSTTTTSSSTSTTSSTSSSTTTTSSSTSTTTTSSSTSKITMNAMTMRNTTSKKATQHAQIEMQNTTRKPNPTAPPRLPPSTAALTEDSGVCVAFADSCATE